MGRDVDVLMWETPVPIFNLWDHARCVKEGRQCWRVGSFEKQKAKVRKQVMRK